jgi:hypothetical protein
MNDVKKHWKIIGKQSKMTLEALISHKCHDKHCLFCKNTAFLMNIENLVLKHWCELNVFAFY